MSRWCEACRAGHRAPAESQHAGPGWEGRRGAAHQRLWVWVARNLGGTLDGQGTAAWCRQVLGCASQQQTYEQKPRLRAVQGWVYTGLLTQQSVHVESPPIVTSVIMLLSFAMHRARETPPFSLGLVSRKAICWRRVVAAAGVAARARAARAGEARARRRRGAAALKSPPPGNLQQQCADQLLQS